MRQSEEQKLLDDDATDRAAVSVTLLTLAARALKQSYL
jgi:hypothetical protein